MNSLGTPMRNSILALSVLCLGGLAAPAWSDPANTAMHEYEQALELTPSVENGRRVYRTCAVCHTPEGWGLVITSYSIHYTKLYERGGVCPLRSGPWVVGGAGTVD